MKHSSIAKVTWLAGMFFAGACSPETTPAIADATGTAIPVKGAARGSAPGDSAHAGAGAVAAATMMTGGQSSGADKSSTGKPAMQRAMTTPASSDETDDAGVSDPGNHSGRMDPAGSQPSRGQHTAAPGGMDPMTQASIPSDDDDDDDGDELDDDDSFDDDDGEHEDDDEPDDD